MVAACSIWSERGGHRHSLHDTARSLVEPSHPGQHGFLDRLGQSRPAGQDLGDEEGVAVGQSHEVPGIQSVVRGEPGDGGHGEGRDGEAMRRVEGDQLSQHRPELVVGSHFVVTVGAHQDRPGVPHTSSQEPQEIEGRLVGPVDVLDRHHHGSRGVSKPVQDLVEDLDGVTVEVETMQTRVRVGGEIVERAEWPWRRERVAGTLDEKDRVVEGLDEGAYQRGLAGSRLTGDQDHRSLTRCSVLEPSP